MTHSTISSTKGPKLTRFSDQLKAEVKKGFCIVQVNAEGLRALKNAVVECNDKEPIKDWQALLKLRNRFMTFVAPAGISTCDIGLTYDAIRMILLCLINTGAASTEQRAIHDDLAKGFWRMDQQTNEPIIGTYLEAYLR
tara:strand:+ start:50794 stop:51210 length:417 start_codon:yes stop_codon:yes gene_type:complete